MSLVFTLTGLKDRSSENASCDSFPYPAKHEEEKIVLLMNIKEVKETNIKEECLHHVFFWLAVTLLLHCEHQSFRTSLLLSYFKLLLLSSSISQGGICTIFCTY